jgi:DNA polymerase III epsilon subunit-like protein
MEIEPGAEAVHGIGQKRVANSPDFMMALFQVQLLLSHVQKDTVLVTMNGKAFDLPITHRILGNPIFDRFQHFDLYQASCRYLPDLSSRKLGDLHRELLGVPIENAHDAAYDTLASIAVARALAKKVGKTLSALAVELQTPSPYWIMPFGKHAGKTIDEVPKGWAIYMNKHDTLSPDLKATVDYILSR